MKFKIILYLFLFVCIVLFYQIFNTNKILNHQDALIQSQYQTQLQLKDSLSVLKDFRETHSFFSLESNPKFDLQSEVATLVRKQLLEMNSSGGIKTILKSLPKGRFLIDQVQVVNESWVLIGFQSTDYWGQALLIYQKNKNGAFSFKSLDSFVQPL